jgi:hypothetical protein
MQIFTTDVIINATATVLVEATRKEEALQKFKEGEYELMGGSLQADGVADCGSNEEKTAEDFEPYEWECPETIYRGPFLGLDHVVSVCTQPRKEEEESRGEADA